MRLLMHFPENMKMKGTFFSLLHVRDWLQAVHEEWLHDPKSSHLIQQL
jgi:hypothetical protein